MKHAVCWLEVGINMSRWYGVDCSICITGFCALSEVACDVRPLSATCKCIDFYFACVFSVTMLNLYLCMKLCNLFLIHIGFPVDSALVAELWIEREVINICFYVNYVHSIPRRRLFELGFSDNWVVVWICLLQEMYQLSWYFHCKFTISLDRSL